MFGFGKLKLPLITEQFGDEETMANRIVLPALVTPPVPDVRDPNAVDIAEDSTRTITPWLRLPPIEYGRALANLPPVAPRAWQPKSKAGSTSLVGAGGETSYLELAGVDVSETMSLVERLGDAIKGDS